MTRLSDRTPEPPSSPTAPERPSGVTRKLELSDVMQMALCALRVLRGVADETARNELQGIEDVLGRASRADEIADVITRLARIQAEGKLTVASSPAAADAPTALRRVLEASIPIATGLEESAAASALTRAISDLRSGAAIDTVAAAAVQTFGELADATGRAAQKRAALERVTAELVASLERLATSDDKAASSAQAISTEIRKASDIKEIKELQSKLLGHADELVRVASARDQEVRSVTAELQQQVEKVKALESRLHAVTEEAITDPLTRMSNRRGLELTLERLRGTNQVGVLAIDIDHFKKCNDTYGHAAGDLVLRHIAELIKADLRIGDHGFRVGGEEMLILLPDADWAGARATATRVHKRIEQSEVDVGTAIVKVTVSIGISVWMSSETFEDAAARADAALYRAKALGRSRVVG